MIRNKLQNIKRCFLTMNKTISTAESCTGGYLGKVLTDLPGSSKFFKGGIIAYSNEIKEKILKVSPKTLKKYGAVSPQTAKEMAKGVIQLYNTDYAISITGIAGPSGGSKNKPVGLVYICLVKNSPSLKFYIFKSKFIGNRNNIRKKTILKVLEILENTLLVEYKNGKFNC